VHNLTSYCFCGALGFRISQSKRITKLGTSLSEKRKQLASETSTSLKKLDDRQSRKKIVSVSFALFSLLPAHDYLAMYTLL
jgi:hypothetical protein